MGYSPWGGREWNTTEHTHTVCLYTANEARPGDQKQSALSDWFSLHGPVPALCLKRELPANRCFL